ncbi:hypothetical protein [Limnohabitans sp. Rim47]|uniref:hypothetical protein n=1 Tax=Limnohabitans sp. Rim47 TaxID=1100721 RepID=UPI0012DC92B8|nr:hypothetical protein [Limnohabitans sp. Rim47]
MSEDLKNIFADNELEQKLQHPPKPNRPTMPKASAMGDILSPALDMLATIARDSKSPTKHPQFTPNNNKVSE